MSNHWIIDASTAAGLPPDALGGKAFNLAIMTRHHLPVPPWWVVTTAAVDLLLASPELQSLIKQGLAGINAGTPFAEIESRTAVIQEAILNAELPAQWQGTLQTFLAGKENEFFAVRSSVVGEDAAGASFAGQMDSHLFQQGKDAIIHSIKAVIASAFNARALHYRLEHGLTLEHIRAAVIIQEMVEGEVSGVMFTAHPLTGDRKSLLVSAAFGCGEGIVSGICNTDDYTVDANDNITSTLAVKDVAVVFDAEGGQGTKTIELPADKQKADSLTSQQVLALAQLGRKLAALYQGPQDIEWCIRNQQIHLLQTRPVTHLPAPAGQSHRIVFDNSNIQESYCGVTTPLTFSYARRAYATVYEQTMRVIGVREKQVAAKRDMLDHMLGLINGRVYYNINHWYEGLTLLPAFKTNKADMERMMGLADPVDFVTNTNPGFVAKLLRLPQMLRALFSLLWGFRTMGQRVEKFRAHFETVYASVPRQSLYLLSSTELVEEIRRLDRELLQQWTTPIINDFYVMMMNGQVLRGLEAAGIEQAASLQNNLLSGESGIESTEPTKFILRMCATLRQRPALQALLETPFHSGQALLDAVEVADPEFHGQCLEYIERYGDRTMGELKLETTTLRQDPAFLFSILRNYMPREDLTLEALEARESAFRHGAEETAFAAIASKQGNRALQRFKKRLQRLRDAVRFRENMRLARTRMFGLYRSLYRQLGEQWACQGELEKADDIFWLTVEEIEALYHGTAVQTRLKPLVAARREEYAAHEHNEPAHHFITRGVVYQGNDFSYPYAAVQVGDDGVLTGTGCYPGSVTAPVRCIHSPEDVDSLDGQILCAVRTDPGWAPLFPTASGILVERGSTLSHSAVVARELGIPAIVGIAGLMEHLYDGQWVHMDASSGRITPVSGAEGETS